MHLCTFSETEKNILLNKKYAFRFLYKCKSIVNISFVFYIADV